MSDLPTGNPAVPGPTVDAIGEFGLIDRIRRAAASEGMLGGPGVVLGIGDDTAVLRPDPGRALLLTVDVMIEGVHFTRRTTTADLLGRRVLAVNLSDVAAKGGRPRWAAVSLGLPSDTPVDFVDGLYAGLFAEAREFGVAIVGGNVARSPERILVDVTLVGDVPSEWLRFRSGARPGDRVLVTGTLGDSAAGLWLLQQRGAESIDPAFAPLVRRHRLPTPRVAAGQALLATGLVTASMDLSDGLASDAPHIAGASGVGLVIRADRLPLSDGLRALAGATGRDPIDWAVRGGEDYELLLTAPAGAVDELKAASAAVGVSLHEIGEISAEPGQWLSWPDGRREPLGTAIFRHF